MKRLLLLVFALAAAGGGLSAQTDPCRTAEAVAYRAAGDDPLIDSLCRLDLCYPADRTGYTTVVWFHGGGLAGGRREIPEALRGRGFAVAGAGYRLTPDVTVADCIDDAAAAAAWIVENIASYGGDPKRIVVAGHSAGGYLASMIGLDKSRLRPYGIDPDTTFLAVIPYSGQAVTHFARRRELGLPDTQPLIDDLAPLYHVRPDCAPLLILSGDRELEMLGRCEENAYFVRMMRIAGHPNVTFHEFGGYDHGNMPEAGHPVAVRYIRRLERTQGGRQDKK